MRLRAKIQRVRTSLPIDKVLLLHNNAQSHTSIRARETIASLWWTTLLHPPYSPELAPSDYYLFGPTKEGLRGKHYSSDEEVKTAVKKWLKEQSTKFYGAFDGAYGGTLLLRETGTMISRDVIHRGPASF